MYQICYPGTTVFIDMCKSCRGIWLDRSEWNEIHKARSRASHDRAGKKAVTEKELGKLASEEKLSSGYADDIPGIKGALLRFIEGSIDYLTDYGRL